MRLIFLTICFVVVCQFIAPSHQYGTMFTDNITPAFSNQTFFSGYRTFEAFSTSASIGVIAADNVRGFSINTPGPIGSTSSDLSLITSQGIEFGNADSIVSVDAAGHLSMSGQRVDFDASTIDFEGDGDVSMGGIASSIRASSFSLNTVEDIALSSSGAILDIHAPIAITSSSQTRSEFNAHNNLEIVSQSAATRFLSSGDLSLESNYLDIDGQLSFSANTADDMIVNAASIVEFASVSKAKNTFEDMNIVVSSGDIVLQSAGVLSLTTQQEAADITFSAVRNTFVVSRSAAESIIQFDTNSDLRTTADNQVTFANFDENSDITFTGQDDITMQSPDVSVTTQYGSITARNDLNAESTDDMNFFVISEDFKAAAITGNIEVLSTTGAFTLNTEDNFVTHSREAYIDTTSSMDWNANDISVRQNDLNSDGGSLRLNIATSFDVTTGSIEFDTSGTLDFTMGGDAIVTANTIDIHASKAFDEVKFTTEDEVTIQSDNGNIQYQTDIFSMTSNRYLATAEDLFDVVTRNSVHMITGDATTFTSEDVTVNSNFETITMDSADTLLFDMEEYTHSSFSIDFDAGNRIFLQSDDSTDFNIGSSLSAEVEGVLDIDATTVTYNADDTTQFIQDTYQLNSDEVSFTAGEAIYLSQNLPDDRLSFTNIENFVADGDFVTFKAGGSLSVSSTDFSSSGDGSFDVEGFNSVTFGAEDITVDANGVITIASGGGLFATMDDADFTADSTLEVLGPYGQNGLLKFVGSSRIEVSVTEDADFINNDITFSSATFQMFSTSGIEFEGSQNGFGAFNVFAESQMNLNIQDTFSSDSDLGIFFFAGDNFSVETDGVINIFAETAIEIVSPSWQLQGDDVLIDVLFDDGLLTWEGQQLTFNADDLDIIAGDHFSLYSGDTLVFNVANDITLTSQTLLIDGFVSTNFVGEVMEIAATNDINLLAGGATNYNLAGILTSTSADTTKFEAATFVIRSGPADWTTASDLISNSYDGVATYWADQFGTFTATNNNVDYLAAGSIFMNGGAITYTAQGNDNGQSLTGTSDLPEGDVVFESINNDIVINAVAELFYETAQFADVFGAEGIVFDSETTLDVTVFQDFDFFSEFHTEGNIGGGMSYLAGGTGNFQSGNRIFWSADDSFLFEAKENFLTSTGEQGGLLMESEADFLANTVTYQSWKASGDFDINTVNSASFNTVTGSISLFTTGGPINFDVNDAGDLTTTYGGDLSYTAGDMLAFRSDEGQTWTSTTSSIGSTAEQGNLVISSQSDISFTAQGSMILQANGARNPTDGLQINSGATLTFQTDVNEATTLAVNPLNNLVFGNLTHPQTTFTAGGSATQTGFTLTSDGDIRTFSGEETTYTAAFQWETNVARDSSVYSNDPLTITGIDNFNVISDAGIIHLHGQGIDMNGNGPFTATARSGAFEIISHTPKDGLVSFTAAQEALFTANLFRADVGPFVATSDIINMKITKESAYRTTVGGDGSLDFVSGGTLVIDSAGAISVQAVGHDGSVLVQGGDLTIQTVTSGDISLLAAGSMDIDFEGDITYSTGSGFTIDANSNRGEDLTQGDIGFFGRGGLQATSGDTFTFSAGRDVSISSDTTTTLTTTGDVTFSSVDDTTVRFTELTGTSKDLFFGNSNGNGGDVSFITESLKDTVTFAIGDDINWNVGENILGESLGDISFSTSGENTKDEAIVMSTTAMNADFIFSATTGSSTFSASDNFNINTNTGATGVLQVLGFNNAEFSSTGGSTETLQFTSKSDNIALTSQAGNFQINSRGASQFLGLGDTGRVSIIANGISEESHEAIHALGSTGIVIGAPSGTVFVDAYESIEFHANQNPDDIVIGYATPIVPGTLTVPTTSTTSLKTTGLNADIVFNLREPQNGIGTLQIIAGNNGTPLDPKVSASQVDLVASDSILFENESGYQFQGLLEVTATNRPSDIFFTAEGELAGVELSTDPRAALSNIVINTNAAVFDSNGKMTLRSDGETGAFTRILSDEGRLVVGVQSTDVEDHIEISAYRGEMEISASDGDLTFVPEGTQLNFVGRKGIHMDTENSIFLVANDISFTAQDEKFTIRSEALLSDAVSTRFNTGLDFIADTNVFSLTADDIDVTTTGNIYFLFGDTLSFSNVDTVRFNSKNSLAIPMRENSVFAGRTCNIPEEFVIAHNNEYYSAGSSLSNVKDTGVMICYCLDTWNCRPLSQAYPNRPGPPTPPTP